MSQSLDAYASIRRAVLESVEERKLDPRGGQVEAVRDLVAKAVDAYQRRAHAGGGIALSDPAAMIDRVTEAICDFGPLSGLFARSDVEEIFIEGDRVLYLDRGGRLRGLAAPTSETDNRQVIDQLLSETQRHLDAKSPMVQARVLNGAARLSAAIPPIADRLSATLRKYTLRKETLPYLVERDSLTPAAASFLWSLMQARRSLIVSGPPGAGKTSLLSALVAAAPADHCIRCAEEIRELSAPITHGSYYEARPPALDGSGEIALRDLVKFLLAMRPDLIVVGEVRGAEAFELTRAVNAGCGFLCTVHANSAREALTALVNAAIMAGENVGEGIVRKVFGSSIDVVIHLDRDESARVGPDGEVRRQVMEILAVVPAMSDDFSTEPIFVREALGRPLVWTGAYPPEVELIERSMPDGVTLATLLGGRAAPAPIAPGDVPEETRRPAGTRRPEGTREPGRNAPVVGASR
ncbi:MAG TPA: ATPase, T2SS/T4P/T4SS family [Actinomycetota bacterium]|nr:ATPase, T2SS/T4P/T4SS family [Actinomycetota bacterium]